VVEEEVVVQHMEVMADMIHMILTVGIAVIVAAINAMTTINKKRAQ